MKEKTVNILGTSFDRIVPHKPRFVGGAKGDSMNDKVLPGSPALWTGSFTIGRSLLFGIFTAV